MGSGRTPWVGYLSHNLWLLIQSLEGALFVVYVQTIRLPKKV